MEKAEYGLTTLSTTGKYCPASLDMPINKNLGGTGLHSALVIA